METIRNRLLGDNDFIGDRTDHERCPVGRNDLDFKRHTGHRCKCRRDVGAMRLRPARCLRQPADDVAGVLDVVVRKIAVGEIE